jgi:succinate dehydrogenase/fumarate reductase cytochrome b subunit
MLRQKAILSIQFHFSRFQRICGLVPIRVALQICFWKDERVMQIQLLPLSPAYFPTLQKGRIFVNFITVCLGMQMALKTLFV